MTVSFQFGAFHFGARQFDACQFGAFHFDAVPVRRVSVWRDASLARFTLARFPFFFYFDPVGLLWRAYHFLHMCPSFMHRIVCVIYLLIVPTRHRATA